METPKLKLGEVINVSGSEMQIVGFDRVGNPVVESPRVMPEQRDTEKSRDWTDVQTGIGVRSVGALVSR